MSSYNSDPIVDAGACWNFADTFSQDNYGWDTNSYEENFEIWAWHYDYCMDGLWAPALYVKGAFD